LLAVGCCIAVGCWLLAVGCWLFILLASDLAVGLIAAALLLAVS
jgi:hypothetical protein